MRLLKHVCNLGFKEQLEYLICNTRLREKHCQFEETYDKIKARGKLACKVSNFLTLSEYLFLDTCNLLNTELTPLSAKTELGTVLTKT